MRTPHCRGAAIWLGLMFAAVVASGAAATGTLDQALAGDPACPGSFSTGLTNVAGRPLMQSFVPAAQGLASVELCLASFGPSSDVTLIVRSGTLEAPGPVVAASTARVLGTRFTWASFAFAGVPPTAPGDGLILQVLHAGGDSFRWAISCEPGLETCEDAYPAGAAGPVPDGDLAFRTYGDTPMGGPLTPTVYVPGVSR